MGWGPPCMACFHMNATTSKTTVLSYTSLNRTARPFKTGRAPIGKSSNRWFSSGSMRTNNARFKQSCRAASMELSAKPCREPATWLPRKKAEIWKVHSFFGRVNLSSKKRIHIPAKGKKKENPSTQNCRPAKVGDMWLFPGGYLLVFCLYVMLDSWRVI